MVIRIGTWNLENLFKPPNPFAPKTEEEYQAKLDALASAITRMDPMCWRCRRPHRDRGQQPLRVAVSWWRFRLHGWVIQRSSGDRGWLHPLPLRGEPQGAALTLRTQHSPGFAAYQPCLRRRR